MSLRLHPFALVVTLLTAACGGSTTSVTAPTLPAAASGRWTGTAADNTGSGRMEWQLTQQDSSVAGTAILTETATGVIGRGSLAGTFDGRQLTFTITIPRGGFDAPYASCAVTVSGDATIELLLITATYQGTNSCSGEVTSGQLTLNRP